MPTTRQRRIMIASPSASAARDVALAEFLDAHEKVLGDRGAIDIDDVPDPDEEDENMVDVKSLVSRLGDIGGTGIETKVRHVESAAGEVRFHAPKGSIIGAGGKVIPPKLPRPRDSEEAPVAKNKVNKISVEHHGKQVAVNQHTRQGTFMTLHPNMASADAHIDAILDRHEHLESVHHIVNVPVDGPQEIEVRHTGEILHNGFKLGKVKRGEKLNDAIARSVLDNGRRPDQRGTVGTPDLSQYSIGDLRNGHRYGGAQYGLPDKEVFARELRRRGYQQDSSSGEWRKTPVVQKRAHTRAAARGSGRFGPANIRTFQTADSSKERVEAFQREFGVHPRNLDRTDGRIKDEGRRGDRANELVENGDLSGPKKFRDSLKSVASSDLYSMLYSIPRRHGTDDGPNNRSVSGWMTNEVVNELHRRLGTGKA